MPGRRACPPRPRTHDPDAAPSETKERGTWERQSREYREREAERDPERLRIKAARGTPSVPLGEILYAMF